MPDNLENTAVATRLEKVGFHPNHIHKSINIMHHINKLKDKSHIVISIDAEKAFDKFQHPFMIKALQKAGREGTLVQFSSVAQSCLTLYEPMNCSMTGLPVHHQFPEFTQTHVHWVSNAIQLSHPALSPSPPALSFSQHQGLFKWVSSSHQVAKVLEFQLQHQSFQWTTRTDLL